ncbi:MAG: lycopene cyclase family protein [Salegentibacter sp.]
MMVPNYFYVIVGEGLAGLQLALRLKRDLFFQGKAIALIDHAPDDYPEKTWCFWEEGNGNWDSLVSQEWESGKFISSEVDKNLELAPYRYKMIKSSDFRREARKELESAENFHFITDEITEIDPVTRKAHGKKDIYTATHFFDSRVPSDYLESEVHSRIFQHFKGWKINTKNAQFDPSVFTMMDFRLKFRDSTSFSYVLPFSEKEALVEFTFFTPFLTEEKIYDEYLEKYLSEILKIENYSILDSEKGIIPMTDFPFHLENSRHITKIGTGGGWVKPSSGYSFKNTEQKVEKIVENLKNGLTPGKGLVNNKFRKYDAIFLDVLSKRNDLGEQIFTKLYTKNSPQEIFRYLDEETSLSEDLKLMSSLYHAQFLRSFFKKAF